MGRLRKTTKISFRISGSTPEMQTESSFSQEIPRRLCNPKVHYRVHESPPQDLSRTTPWSRLILEKNSHEVSQDIPPFYLAVNYCLQDPPLHSSKIFLKWILISSINLAWTSRWSLLFLIFRQKFCIHFSFLLCMLRARLIWSHKIRSRSFSQSSMSVSVCTWKEHGKPWKRQSIREPGRDSN
jgi:hypothetical protein